MIERHIDINRFDYDLPDGRIAKFPLAERSSSKLLVYRGGEISEAHFADMGDVLPEGQLLVLSLIHIWCASATGSAWTGFIRRWGTHSPSISSASRDRMP